MSDVKEIIDDTAKLVRHIDEVNVALIEYCKYLVGILKDQSPEIPADIGRCLLWYGGAARAKELGYSLDNEAKDLCRDAVTILQKRTVELARQLEENAGIIRTLAEADFEDYFGHNDDWR